MKRIAFYLEIDKTAQTVTFGESRRKLPISRSFTAAPVAIAGVCRDIAAHFLELAFFYDHSGEFAVPDYTNAQRAAQAAKMLEEHKNIFEFLED